MEDIIIYSVGALAVRGLRRAVFGPSREEKLSQEVSPAFEPLFPARQLGAAKSMKKESDCWKGLLCLSMESQSAGFPLPYATSCFTDKIR